MAKNIRFIVTASALVALAVGCGEDTAPATSSAARDGEVGRWSDIDTRYPSEDLVASVYGYVQAMAAGDEDRACSFQYHGSLDDDPDRCVLVEDMPRRDRRFTADHWEVFAAYALDDYEPEEGDRGWEVSLPTEPVTTWRVTQDHAGIWFID